MKLVTFLSGATRRLGAVHDQRVVDLAALAPNGAAMFATARRFLEAGDTAMAVARSALASAIARGDDSAWPRLADVTLVAPIPDPPTIYALAANYRAHIREGGGAVVPKEQLAPQVFVKPATAIIGPGDAIRLPGPICTKVDYEAELAAVIGRPCYAVQVDEALEYAAGYLNFNDVSGRSLNVDISREAKPGTEFFDWLNGKWFDTFAPMGPFLVTRDEIPDPQDLPISLWVNGALRQHARTGDMIFSVAEGIAWLSQFVTLQPGDIIATGTPSGVSLFFVQPV